MEGILDPVSQNVICTLTLYCVSFIYSFCYSVYMDYINLSVEKCGVFCFLIYLVTHATKHKNYNLKKTSGVTAYLLSQVYSWNAQTL